MLAVLTATGSGGAAMASHRRHQHHNREGVTGPDPGLPLSSIPDNQPASDDESTGGPRAKHKVVHFVRHGEGYHNIGHDELLDSPLTSRGWADAEGLRAHLETLKVMGHPLELEAVFVSPLTRALETACGAFGGRLLTEDEEARLLLNDVGECSSGSLSSYASASSNRAQSSSNGNGSGDGGSRSSGSGLGGGVGAAVVVKGNGNGNGSGDVGEEGEEGPSDLLMRSQTHNPGKRSAHDAIAAVPGLPFIAVEEFRERMSNHECDKRRPLSLIKPQFPGVDFSLIKHDEDIVWDKRHTQSVNEGARGSRYLVGEKSPAVMLRGTRFIEWLLRRPENNVAVVAHREVLLRTLTALAADAPPDVRRALSSGFSNCEMRSVVFDGQGTPVEVLSSTAYPGGAARLWLFPYNWALQKGKAVFNGVRSTVA